MNETTTPAQQVVVESLRQEALDTVSLTLRSVSHAALAPWLPGAHIDVELPNWLRRQYSLCGDPADPARYRIAVRRQALSRGGSEYVHDFLREGQELTVSVPRNNFSLREAAEYVFIAGGIGIAPLLPMVRQVASGNASWRLIYGGRDLASMPFIGELPAVGTHVNLFPADRLGNPDLADLLAPVPDHALVYCCGPSAMMSAVERALAPDNSTRLHVERFQPTPRQFRPNAAFTVECRKTEVELVVDSEDSLLDVLIRAGLPVGVGCREGICGACEIRVVDGEVEHRDELGAPGERLYPCVSRSLSERLVLDL